MPLPVEEKLEFSLQKTERVYVRISLGIIIGLCLLVAICWAGRRGYVRWQERTLMRQAHVAFDKGDLRWAALAGQRAYSYDPASADACRVLADIAQRQNGPEAIEWRRRALVAAPESLGDRVALANTALRFSQPGVAAEALAKIAPNEQQNADFQSAAAHLALTQNDFHAAADHLRAAARLAPNDAHRQVELAEFLLRSDDRALRDEGAAQAAHLKNDPQVRLDVMHILISDALRRGYDADSVALAKELDATPDAPAGDRLLALEILRRYDEQDFTAALSRLESEATRSADDATRLIGWLNTHGLALLAIDWSRQLSPESLDNVGLRFVLADSFVQARDWKALQNLLARGSWARAGPLRLAFGAKAARETGDEAGFEKKWAAAIEQAGGNPERLKILQKLAAQCRWPDKAADVLWSLANDPAQAPEALPALYNYYAAARDTPGLYRTLTRLVEVMPNDLAVKNNFAQIALLLNADPERARAAASEVHEAQPQNPAFASTFAFDLYRAGNVRGALKVMEALSPAQLSEPSVAAYYSLFLADAGRKKEAEKFLAFGEKAKLLPEELRLVARVREIVSPPAPYHGNLGPSK